MMRAGSQRAGFRLWLWLAIAGATGCSIPPRQHAVPATLTETAEIPGIPGVRYVMPGDTQEFMREALESYHKEQAYLAASRGLPGNKLPPANYLALSGGSDDGAFGAGLLCGWTASGQRPEFKVVTGISTGALLAPLAFLGPKYDPVLRSVYTEVSPQDIFRERGLLAAIFDDALADNAPLAGLVEKHITPAVLKEIAAEYAKGRLLLMATTNLDSREGVIWNMTRIAASGHPQALKLMHRLMLASAAIPGVFPPAMIDVEVNGQPYQEMHVDGGAMATVFAYPVGFKLAELSRSLGVARERHLYLIRNSRINPDWSEVERQTLSVFGRAVMSLIHTQGLGDLYRIYATTQRDGVDYNLAYIPTSFYAPHPEPFDPSYMRKLFDTGYRLAAKGYPWDQAPPGLAP